MDKKNTIGRRIKHLRLESGMTQDALAALAEIHRPNLTMIERGSRPCGYGTGYRIARALRKDIEDIMGGKKS
jgi:DNA-binding XRE family transcriptional regulator